MSTLEWLWNTFLVKIGLQFDAHTVETEKISNSRARIIVKNERTGEVKENTAGGFIREELDNFRGLEA